MLILSRETNEGFTIELEDGRLIRIVVSDIRRSQVKLAIDAPKTIAIRRNELMDGIREERQKA